MPLLSLKKGQKKRGNKIIEQPAPFPNLKGIIKLLNQKLKKMNDRQYGLF